MEMPKPNIILLLSAILFQLFSAAYSIGIVYSTAPGLPPALQVAEFLKSKTVIDSVRIPDTNPDVIKAFADTNISLTVTIPNADIPKLLRNSPDAKEWVSKAILPFYPKTKITNVAIGEDVITKGPKEATDMLAKAHKYLHQGIVLHGIFDIKATTIINLEDVLLPSDMPSQASFKPGLDVGILAPLLQVNTQNFGPFMVKLQPYLKFNNLDMALFRPSPGFVDKVSGKTYTNTFDMQVDSVYSAMKKLGYPNIEIVVAETGWPTVGNPAQTPVNAGCYIRGLTKKVTSDEGTPLLPGRTFRTFVADMFECPHKPGFGLFKPDMTPAFDNGLMR